MIKAKKIFFITLFLFQLSQFLQSQTNLVPNPSFETYTLCPNNAAQLNRCNNWFSPTTGTPDYFNACAPANSYFNVPVTEVGFSPANSGSAMAGIDVIDDIFGGPIFREYLAIKLVTPLISTKKYFITYYARLSDSSRYSTNQINLFFGDSIKKNTYDTINVIPQISNLPTNFVSSKISWTKLRGNFIANGTEKFLYIGDFKHPINNDTLYVTGGGRKLYYTFAYYFIDDICVSDDSLYSENFATYIQSFDLNNLKIYPNPIKNVLFLENYEADSNFKLYDILGSEIIIYNVKGGEINLAELKSGVYILKYETKNKRIYNYKLIKE